MMIAEYAPHAMMVILIVAMGIELRTGKVPNLLTLLPFVLFIVVAAMADDKSILAWQLGLGAGVFVLGLLLFAFAGFGAGAVKLMAGLALFIPLAKGWVALGVFVAALFVMSFILVKLRKYEVGSKSTWHVFTNTKTLPMSMPLAVTGAAVFYLL